MGDVILAGLIVYLTCHYVTNVVLSGLAGATEGIVFNHRIGQISANHSTEITPAPATFMIWNVIYVWLLCGYLFLCVNLFRSSNSDKGTKRYCNPTVFSRSVALALILNACFMTAWLFIWDAQMMTLAAVFLGLIAATNWFALVTFSKNLWSNVVILKTEATGDLWAYRILLHNGLACYTTWTTLATLINFAVALVYDADMPEPAPSLIALAILTVFLTVWTPLELIFWDNYFRYMMTPLFTVLWALVGIYRKQNSTTGIDDSVANFTLSLLVGTCILIVVRALVIIYRHFRRPLYIGLAMVSSSA